MFKNTKLIVILLILLVADLAYGFAANRDIMVNNARVRAMAPGTHSTAVYMDIENTGRVDHKLVGVSSKFGHAMLHQTVSKKGMFKMEHVDQVNIVARKTLVLKPGSYHIMLTGVKGTLKVGQVVPLTLSFNDGEKIRVDARVKKIK